MWLWIARMMEYHQYHPYHESNSSPKIYLLCVVLSLYLPIMIIIKHYYCAILSILSNQDPRMYSLAYTSTVKYSSQRSCNQIKTQPTKKKIPFYIYFAQKVGIQTVNGRNRKQTHSRQGFNSMHLHLFNPYFVIISVICLFSSLI